MTVQGDGVLRFRGLMSQLLRLDLRTLRNSHAGQWSVGVSLPGTYDVGPN